LPDGFGRLAAEEENELAQIDKDAACPAKRSMTGTAEAVR
jgi:hypothetical protein